MATNQKPVNQAKAINPVIEKEEVESVKAEIRKPELPEVLEYLKLSSDIGNGFFDVLICNTTA